MIRKKILKNIEDTYTTEQELLKSLDITHEKLKEHILKLKDVGYKIVYDEEKGYKLQETPDILAPYEISRGLKTEKIGNNLKKGILSYDINFKRINLFDYIKYK